MKPPVISVAASTVLAAAIFLPGTGHAAPAPFTPKMSVAIASATPATVIRKNASVTFHLQLRVKGIVLDPKHIGKANIPGHGHVQVYVDRIPKEAYVRKHLKQPLLASLAGRTIRITVPPALIGSRGTHRLYVALAQNNQVLYRGVPAARTTIIVK
jgi:hypothetical protein